MRNIFCKTVLLSVLCLGLAISGEAAGWQGVPILLNLSDAVRPGKTFRVNGFGFEEGGSLVLEKDVQGLLPDRPSGKSLQPEILQKDRNGNFLVAVLPASVISGVYNVWVKNGAGWSKPAKLNIARPLFLSEREVFQDLVIKVSGRNLDDREFDSAGDKQHTRIRLRAVNGKHFYHMRVLEVNPYCVSFLVQHEPPGRYRVEVSSDNGRNWAGLSNDQELTILKRPSGEPADYDPLGMGVAWASHFNWKNRHRVMQSNNGKEVTALVQAMIDTVGAQPGGGIVYFSDGLYKISRLNLHKNVVLLGESKKGTVISYCGHEKDFITCTGSAIRDGHVGVANMRLIIPPEIKERPDVFINLGQAAIWQGVSNIRLRTASEMFLVNLELDYDFTETVPDHRGLPSSVIGRERYFISHCDFRGFRLESHNYVSDYVTVKNNRFEYAQGVFVYTGNYLFLENNHIIGHTEINREKHGFMFRANAYVYSNTVEHTGSEEDPHNENWNDGEALCNETPGGSHNFGSVRTATVYSIVAGETAGPFTVPVTEIYNHRSVMIVGGRGLGQYRRVTRIDPVSKTMWLEKKWDVIPDSSSRFTLMEPNENTTYYRNTIIDNPKGYWLFGNSIDCVVAENTSIDCDGVFIFSCMTSTDGPPDSLYYFVPNYFNRVTGNIIRGVSRKSHRAGVGINTTREGKSNGTYFGVEDYANEFRNNTIEGVPDAKPLAVVTEAPPVSGIFVLATVHSSAYDGKNIAGDATNHLIEDNILKNLATGITLSRCVYGQVLCHNSMDKTVGIPYADSESQQTVYVKHAAEAEVLSPDPEAEVWSPEPRVVVPGQMWNAPPSDCLVLFDGSNLDEWVSTNDNTKPAGWRVRDKILTVDKKAGNIQTRKLFMDYQLHLEWMIPATITGEGQSRGNSGVILAGTGAGDSGYELQVLDSYHNKTYINGQAGSIYKQYPPLVNTCKAPGEWQTYDIVWTAPRFYGDGTLKSAAHVIVFQNGILIQNDVVLHGPTAYYPDTYGYKKHGPASLKLQAHGDSSEPIHFRNIWIREI